MAAVIWTDVVQMRFISANVCGDLYAGGACSGGLGQIHEVAAAAGKFRLFNFAFNLTQSYTFWAGVLGGTFLTMASHGTDQLMVQRMLAARNLLSRGWRCSQRWRDLFAVHAFSSDWGGLYVFMDFICGVCFGG